MATFVEDLHPRGGKGSPEGGRFVSKGGGDGSAAAKPGSWELDAAEKAEVAGYKKFQDTNHQPLELSATDRDAVKNYAGTGASITLNMALRNDKQMDARLTKTRDGLDALMARSELSEDTVLYRSYGLFGAPTPSSFEQIFKTMKPGDSFVDKGFVSTSYKPFSQYNLIILAPKGSKAFPVPDDLGFENEIILACGSRLEFVGDIGDSKVLRLSQGGK